MAHDFECSICAGAYKKKKNAEKRCKEIEANPIEWEGGAFSGCIIEEMELK